MYINIFEIGFFYEMHLNTHEFSREMKGILLNDKTYVIIKLGDKYGRSSTW